ncbi:hypothetical protein [Cyanobium sp. CH-040]|uniref:hypothetical protein n=1 Tax=Cyanobium sp. CH-040 TaxID=2823708 RepID=UPI0020CDF9A5|nr:hypothetical protein [Cyanobium sp. CH-040]MCP9928329.1 hypothetical protein [Cyanobium sp. CH-040]
MPELFGFRLLQEQPGLVAALQIAEDFPLLAIPEAATTATHSALSAKVGADEPPGGKNKSGGGDGTNPGGGGNPDGKDNPGTP